MKYSVFALRVILFIFMLQIYVNPVLVQSCSADDKPYLSGKTEQPIHEKAKQFLEKGDIDNAIKVYENTLIEFKPTEYCVMFVINNQIKIYRDRKMYNKAEQALLSLRDMPITPTTLYGPDLTPYGLQREFHISHTLSQWYEESGDYEKAIEKRKESIEWHHKLVNATDYEAESKHALEPFNSQEIKAVMYLQSGPGELGNLYYKWGKYDLAREKYTEEIKFLTSESTRNSIFSKLRPEYRLAWEETNPRIVFPMEIAKCYEKEEKYSQALSTAEQINKKINDPGFKKQYEQFDSAKVRIEMVRDKDLMPLISRCKANLKEKQTSAEKIR